MSDVGSIRALSGDCGLVLLYHASFSRLPDDISRGLHNIRPTIMRAQLEGLCRHFTFVDVDSFAALPDPRGYAAVTFDDGYRSVFDEALPILEDLGIPFTVYLNGAVLQGAVFWRDKVRLIESRGWVNEFEAFMRGIAPVPGRRFYRYSKDPGVDSSRVDAEIDRFLAAKGAAVSLPRYCVDNPGDLPVHPLVAYGNHGHHHYVMASLDRDRQQREIEATQEVLSRLPGCRVSRLFSLPFGDEGDFNRETVAALGAAGYATVLLSRNRLHRGRVSMHGIAAVERVMPADDARGFLAPLDAKGRDSA